MKRRRNEPPEAAPEPARGRARRSGPKAAAEAGAGSGGGSGSGAGSGAAAEAGGRRRVLLPSRDTFGLLEQSLIEAVKEHLESHTYTRPQRKVVTRKLRDFTRSLAKNLRALTEEPASDEEGEKEELDPSLQGRVDELEEEVVAAAARVQMAREEAGRTAQKMMETRLKAFEDALSKAKADDASVFGSDVDADGGGGGGSAGAGAGAGAGRGKGKGKGKRRTLTDDRFKQRVEKLRGKYTKLATDLSELPAQLDQAIRDAQTQVKVVRIYHEQGDQNEGAGAGAGAGGGQVTQGHV